MKADFKNWTKYFGGKYMKYWYIAFAVVVAFMFASSINDAGVKNFKYTAYNRDGSVNYTEDIPIELIPFKIKADEPKAIEPVKTF